ncbi:hypothetical protein AOLI_G00031640 [Acnodon oligacanthus]
MKLFTSFKDLGALFGHSILVISLPTTLRTLSLRSPRIVMLAGGVGVASASAHLLFCTVRVERTAQGCQRVSVTDHPEACGVALLSGSLPLRAVFLHRLLLRSQPEEEQEVVEGSTWQANTFTAWMR